MSGKQTTAEVHKQAKKRVGPLSVDETRLKPNLWPNYHPYVSQPRSVPEKELAKALDRELRNMTKGGKQEACAWCCESGDSVDHNVEVQFVVCQAMNEFPELEKGKVGSLCTKNYAWLTGSGNLQTLCKACHDMKNCIFCPSNRSARLKAVLRDVEVDMNVDLKNDILRVCSNVEEKLLCLDAAAQETQAVDWTRERLSCARRWISFLSFTLQVSSSETASDATGATCGTEAGVDPWTTKLNPCGLPSDLFQAREDSVDFNKTVISDLADLMDMEEVTDCDLADCHAPLNYGVNNKQRHISDNKKHVQFMYEMMRAVILGKVRSKLNAFEHLNNISESALYGVQNKLCALLDYLPDGDPVIVHVIAFVLYPPNLAGDVVKELISFIQSELVSSITKVRDVYPMKFLPLPKDLIEAQNASKIKDW